MGGRRATAVTGRNDGGSLSGRGEQGTRAPRDPPQTGCGVRGVQGHPGLGPEHPGGRGWGRCQERALQSEGWFLGPGRSAPAPAGLLPQHLAFVGLVRGWGGVLPREHLAVRGWEEG